MDVTGAGESANRLEEGQLVGEVLPRGRLPMSVMFHLANNEFQARSTLAEILCAGGAWTVASLVQINFRVPADIGATGDSVPILLIIGSRWTVSQVTFFFFCDRRIENMSQSQSGPRCSRVRA